MNKILLEISTKSAIILIISLGILLFWPNLSISNFSSNKPIANENKIAPEPKIDPTGTFVEDELIVKFKEGFSEQGQKGILKALNVSVLREDSRLKAELLQVSPSQREKVLEALEKNPNVEYIEPNYVIKTQDGFGGGGGGAISGPEGCGPFYPNDFYFCQGFQNYFHTLNLPAGWLGHKGSSSIAIAVLDSGVDYNHYDLGLAPSGRVVKGFDHWNQDSDPIDDNGHGTAVAGVVGAKTNNVSGIAGVDWFARIVAIKVASSSGFSTPFVMAQGIYDAVELSATYNKVIINISASTPSNSQTLKNAITTAINNNNVYVVASVVNSPTKNCFMQFPAAYSGVISVVALNGVTFASGCTGNVKSGITYQKLQISAPGKDIFTLWKNGGIGYQPPPSSSAPGATSFAAAIVSGMASIVASCSNTVYTDVITGATDLGPAGWDSTYGYGFPNLWNFLYPSCN